MGSFTANSFLFREILTLVCVAFCLCDGEKESGSVGRGLWVPRLPFFLVLL